MQTVARVPGSLFQEPTAAIAPELPPMDPVLDLAFAADELSDPDLGDPDDSIGDFVAEPASGA